MRDCKMEHAGIEYAFTARIWYSEWYFVSLPDGAAAEIRKHFKNDEEGWGRLKVHAKIGGSEWKTAIWWDTKHGTYLLPIKGDIRKREKLGVNHQVQVTLWI